MSNTILNKLGIRISNEIKAIKNQLLTISSGSIPSGIVLSFTGLIAPSGFLLCHGQEVSRTTYATLFALIGTSYGIGDNTSTFNLPDYRGYFLRGLDMGTGRDSDPTRVIGSIQEDSIKNHAHNVNCYSGGSSGGSLALDNAIIDNGSYRTGSMVDAGQETRPKNIAVNYVIKF